jgi:hypothetical protein
MSVLVPMVEANSSTSRSHRQRETLLRSFLQTFSLRPQNYLAVRIVSEALELRTLARAHMPTLIGGTRRHIILNSLMWLKCVLHLQVLHALGDLFLERLIALELAPVHHLIWFVYLSIILLLIYLH